MTFSLLIQSDSHSSIYRHLLAIFCQLEKFQCNKQIYVDLTHTLHEQMSVEWQINSHTARADVCRMADQLMMIERNSQGIFLLKRQGDAVVARFF